MLLLERRYGNPVVNSVLVLLQYTSRFYSILSFKVSKSCVNVSDAMQAVARWTPVVARARRYRSQPLWSGPCVAHLRRSRGCAGRGPHERLANPAEPGPCWAGGAQPRYGTPADTPAPPCLRARPMGKGRTTRTRARLTRIVTGPGPGVRLRKAFVFLSVTEATTGCTAHFALSPERSWVAHRFAI